MFIRNLTKPVKVKNITIGHQNKIVIQSMTNTKTSDVVSTLNQINELVAYGCEIVRLAIVDQEDLVGLKELVKLAKVPLVADIHYDPSLAIGAIKANVAKIRINPGNFPNLKAFSEVIKLCKKYHTAMRIGMNTGSLPFGVNTNEQIIELIGQYIKICEQHNFNQIVLSIKDTDYQRTIELYELLAKNFAYPLHIGVTEAGDLYTSSVRSTLALSKLINEQIGDTIRISISGDPVQEVKLAKVLLQECGLDVNLTKFIGCPTCGRMGKRYFELLKIIKPFIDQNPKHNITVAVMGCTVNGVQESKKADLGIYCYQNDFVIYYQQKFIGKFNLETAIKTFKELYLKY
ncbi:MAG: flavodoxin-dependent (E)-4-hydroxy-3-methylbut-2-enyl-diphosphate synthase [Mycoplasma sp.]